MSRRQRVTQDGRDAFWAGRRYTDNPYSGREKRWWSFGFGLGASDQVNEMFKNPKKFFSDQPTKKAPTQLSLF